MGEFSNLVLTLSLGILGAMRRLPHRLADTCFMAAGAMNRFTSLGLRTGGGGGLSKDPDHDGHQTSQENPRVSLFHEIQIDAFGMPDC